MKQCPVRVRAIITSAPQLRKGARHSLTGIAIEAVKNPATPGSGGLGDDECNGDITPTITRTQNSDPLTIDKPAEGE